MKYTKSQRHEFYKHVLAQIENEDFTDGICVALWNLTTLSMGDIMFEFPELAKLKPKNAYDHNYWFDFSPGGMQQRVDVLKECVEETRAHEPQTA